MLWLIDKVTPVKVHQAAEESGSIRRFTRDRLSDIEPASGGDLPSEHSKEQIPACVPTSNCLAKSGCSTMC